MKSQAFSTNNGEPSGVVTGLYPYSNYKMYIVVANNRFEGPPSNNIHFSTPEGVPSVPRSFRIQQRHLDSIYVDWDLPAEPNGIITGYSLKYQTVNASRGEELRVEEFPPNVTSFSIRRFDRYTRYRFSVAARTEIGIGEWYTEESPHYTTEIYAQDQVDISTQGWFIGIMCAVALIVLILLVVCFIKRSRGGKYPVREKKEVALEPVDDIDQDGSFDYRSLERIARISTLPYSRREEERGLQRAQPPVEVTIDVGFSGRGDDVHLQRDRKGLCVAGECARGAPHCLRTFTPALNMVTAVVVRTNAGGGNRNTEDCAVVDDRKKCPYLVGQMLKAAKIPMLVSLGGIEEWPGTVDTLSFTGTLVVDGPSAIDEIAYLLRRKRRGVPAVRERGRDDVDVGQQQVRRQVRLRSSHPEQVAVVGHQLMLDQGRRENCWKS
ncbi:hypothetical protein fugu_007033 [Takifugu bimaculatus]|uniref:Fibronectin type-III domain-containing protein n=1 Tax=Takifugu bimaculatus TaxID=433685 RepID=A0A4Z2B354_9TELE|nr:hypothetical protein fugu_007033 [Takifugu bimaculatus]